MTRLFLASLGSGFGDLGGTSSSLLNRLDDTDSNGLTHVTDGETAQRGVVGESLHTHRLGGNHLDDGGVTRLDELGGLFNGLTSSSVNLLADLGELAGNVGSVAIEDGSVTSTDLTGVVEDDDLSVERSGTHGGVVLGVTGNVTTTDILDRDVLHVESDVITGVTLSKLLVVHFHRLDFSGDVGRSEGNDHTGLEDTSFDTADGNSSNTTNLVHVLEGKTKGLVGGTLGGLNGVNGLEQGLSGGLASLGLLLPTLVPGAVGGGGQHVVAVETRDGHKGNGLGVISNLLDEVGGFLNDFLVTCLGPLSGVHLVDGNDELLDTQSVGEQGVLTSLAILGDTSLELTSTGSDNKNSAIGLGSTSNHVLDKITVAGSVWYKMLDMAKKKQKLVCARLTNDSDHVLGSLKLPKGNVDGDTTLTLGLELVKNPRILERTLAEFGGFLQFENQVSNMPCLVCFIFLMLYPHLRRDGSTLRLRHQLSQVRRRDVPPGKVRPN